MPNEQKPEGTPEELGEEELEKVAGGTGDSFDGKYLVTGATHTADLSRTSKIEALAIKQKVSESSS